MSTARNLLILAADVGGTKTSLALFEHGPEGPRKVRAGRYASQSFETFESLNGT